MVLVLSKLKDIQDIVLRGTKTAVFDAQWTDNPIKPVFPTGNRLPAP